MNTVPASTIFSERFTSFEQLPCRQDTMASLAYDPQLGRKVFVKQPNPLKADEQTRIRLQREADILDSLDHPQIPKVIMARPDGSFVTEAKPGSSATRERFRRGVTANMAAQLCLSALQPLAYVHEQGITHRDFKLNNLMFPVARPVSLVDFDIALCKDDTQAQGIYKTANVKSSRITQEGLVKGTLDYVSPEQVVGRRATPRSDVYAAGVVLYELLAGELPFKGKDAQEIALKHYSQPINIGPIEARGVSDGLLEVILTATEKDPAYRYESAGAMAEELARSAI